MHTLFRTAGVSTALLLASASTVLAQQRAGLIGDLLRDVTEVEAKLVGLANAMPADKYGWRPREGVRSVGEVFLHVAGDNYLLPTGFGVAAPAATGIKGEDYQTVTAYESRKLGRDPIIAELQESFAHLKKALSDTPDAKLGETVKLFGQNYTVQQVWVMATTHLHEYLGQSIAYARTNGVVPPWSR